MPMEFCNDQCQAGLAVGICNDRQQDEAGGNELLILEAAYSPNAVADKCPEDETTCRW